MFIMESKRINGYSFEIYPLPEGGNTRFVTLRNGSTGPYHFNLEKIDGNWRIRNPSTVPAFIVEIETEIVKHL
jgi:hypothetical protein